LTTDPEVHDRHIHVASQYRVVMQPPSDPPCDPLSRAPSTVLHTATPTPIPQRAHLAHLPAHRASLAPMSTRATRAIPDAAPATAPPNSSTVPLRACLPHILAYTCCGICDGQDHGRSGVYLDYYFFWTEETRHPSALALRWDFPASSAVVRAGEWGCACGEVGA
jgi:hypothetical protein